MLEYYVIDTNYGDVKGLEHRLNILTEDGWRVVCSVGSMVILEREKQPSVDEENNETARVVTYTWPHYGEKPSK